MKHIEILTIAAFIGFCNAQEPVDYPVRGIPPDSAKFAEILDSARKTETTFAITILQHVGENRYLAERGEEYFAIDVLPGRPQLVDGQEITVAISGEGGVYQFTTVLGANKTVNLFTERPGLSAETFIERLKAGETFLVSRQGSRIRCEACGGFGGSSLQKTTCRACGGRGYFIPTLKFRLVW